MLDEKELTKRLMAWIETDAQFLPFQISIANSIVRRIAPMVLGIIREEVRTARREHWLKTRQD